MTRLETCAITAPAANVRALTSANRNSHKTQGSAFVAVRHLRRCSERDCSCWGFPCATPPAPTSRNVRQRKRQNLRPTDSHQRFSEEQRSQPRRQSAGLPAKRRQDSSNAKDITRRSQRP